MTQLRSLPGHPDPEHFWVGFENLQIAGDTWGELGNRLVILLHGGGQTRHAWKGVGEQLSNLGYFAVALDARGHGDSDWSPKGDYGPEASSEDLKAVMRQLGRSSAILVGASMGGTTALVAASEGYVDADGIVLVDVTPVVNLEGVARVRSFMSQGADGFSSLEEVELAIANYLPHRTRPRNLDGLAKNVRLDEDGRYRWHWDPRFIENPWNRAETSERLRHCLSRIAVPTLLVRGRLSDVVSEESVRDYFKLCPHGRFAELDNAAHMVAGDRNDLFMSAITAFLIRELPPIS